MKRLISLYFTLLLSNMMLCAQQRDIDDEWMLVAKDIDPAFYYGITTANGVIGIVSSPQPFNAGEVVLNGAFDTYGRGRVSNIMRTFSFTDLQMELDGKFIGKGHITDYRQLMDLRDGTFISEGEVDGKLRFRISTMALRHLPYTAMVLVELEALEDVRVMMGNEIEAPDILREVNNHYAVIDRPHARIPLMTSVGISPTGKHTIAVCNSIIFPEDLNDMPGLIHEEWDYNRHLLKFEKSLRRGQQYRFAVIGSTLSTAHADDPHNEAERLTVYAQLEGIDRLLHRHRQAWRELWKGDIIIEGDPRSQLAVRSALYHLYAFNRAGTAYSPSPMGLSGLGYNGHAFWDTELWMLPPLLVLQPELARSMIEYRFDRLPMARKKAFAHGYRGAMFPWESDESGQEATPVWALTGPYEHHISGCVAWATWQYFAVTGDKRWLSEKGYPILSGVADFWSSRVERASPERYDILNVVGADEWAENIDNNAFTNAVAAFSLRAADRAAAVLGLPADPDWVHVADRIPLLYFPNGVIREHDRYSGEMIKQADVNLLAHPLDLINQDQMKKDLDYYKERMSPQGPAMGFSVLSVLYSRLSDPEEAFSYFRRSYQPNELPPFGVLAETAGGTNPYFATGAGGLLQAVIYGFGGIRITDDGFQYDRVMLPSGWRSLTITNIGGSGRELKIVPLK